MADMLRDPMHVLLSTYSADSALNDDARILCMNAQSVPELSSVLSLEHTDMMQFFKPYARGLEAAGFQLVTVPEGLYDAALICGSKNMIEMRYWLALAAQYVRSGGVVYCAAHNKAGGTRLVKMLQDFGFAGVQQSSAKKCRVAYGVNADSLCDRAQEALTAGAVQPILGGAYVSQPGLYGWDKIDAGSALLMQHCSGDMRGRRAADFGCGYGYLAAQIVPSLAAPYKFYVIDADQRAVELCAQNLSNYHGVEPIWADITASTDLPRNLDFIVMNPPFHEGKKENSAIGQAFIVQAARALRSGGKLYMVANVHLPYEACLAQNFAKVEKRFEGHGFKIFVCVGG